MANITTLTLADGLATPANHTFDPYTPQQGTQPAQWLNKESTAMIGYRRVTMRLDLKTAGVTKVTMVIADPVLASVPAGCCVDSNTPQVAYTDFCNISFSLPSGSTIQNRKDILAFAKSLLASSVVSDAVVGLTPAF